MEKGILFENCRARKQEKKGGGDPWPLRIGVNNFEFQNYRGKRVCTVARTRTRREDKGCVGEEGRKLGGTGRPPVVCSSPNKRSKRLSSGKDRRGGSLGLNRWKRKGGLKGHGVGSGAGTARMSLGGRADENVVVGFLYKKRPADCEGGSGR